MDAADKLPGASADGREALKGILGGEAYPLIWIDTEDDPRRKTADRREAAMLHMRSEVQAAAVAGRQDLKLENWLLMRPKPWLDRRACLPGHPVRSCPVTASVLCPATPSRLLPGYPVRLLPSYPVPSLATLVTQLRL